MELTVNLVAFFMLAFVVIFIPFILEKGMKEISRKRDKHGYKEAP